MVKYRYLLIDKGLSGGKLIIRKCITFLATFIVLAASFAVIYGLSTVQASNQQNQYISLLISLSIVVFNTIINCKYLVNDSRAANVHCAI